MKTISHIKEYKEWLQEKKTEFFRKEGRLPRIGFVPTMGALHSGHFSLVKAAKEKCDFTVMSIYVNPTQFVLGEDFERYPRTLQADLYQASLAQVDVVYTPDSQEVYPKDFSTFVNEQKVSLPLCGQFRPGHFQGVTTIVLKLFHSVEPTVAFFGLKDVQQFYVIKKMVYDLNMPIEVVGVPTVREYDGLAMSSRNVYLLPSERECAPLLFQTLAKTVAELKSESGRCKQKEVLEKMHASLESKGFRMQYLNIRECPLLTDAEINPLKPETEYVLAVAALLGKTRLIDNILFRI